MEFIFLVFVFNVHAFDIFSATSSEILNSDHQKETLQNLLLKRCDVELKRQYVPLHCFEWLKKGSLRPAQKVIMLNHLQTQCRNSLAGDRGPQNRFLYVKYMENLEGDCLIGVRRHFEDLKYKESEENHLDFNRWIETSRH